MNSSMSLLASFDSLNQTDKGLPESSISNFTSTRSKAMDPARKRSSRIFCASPLSKRISSASSPLPVSMISWASS